MVSSLVVICPVPPRPAAVFLRPVSIPILALVLVALAVLPGAMPETFAQQPPVPVAPTPSEPFEVPGRVLGAPALITSEGPLFALSPIVARLGGELARSGASVTLTLGETEIVGGAGNPVMLVDREIVRLSQPPRLDTAGLGDEGEVEGAEESLELLVPLDFLRQSFGEHADWTFDWDRQNRLLTAERRRVRELAVSIDVVHLQGVTTVVLEVPERFAYRVVERGGDLEVVPRRDRFRPGTVPRRLDDPLVQGVRVEPERVVIDLAPGTAAEGYTLEDPFRLVFDVVERPELSRPEIEAPEEIAPPRRSRPSPGVATIVLDPGHGGGETGAISPSGLAEKDLVLDIARTLRTRLMERMPVKVVLTRTEDAALPHDTRSAIANQNKADLFISIHLNSVHGPEAHGAETYFLSLEASDRRAASSAAEENAGAPAAGEMPAGAESDALYDLQLILWDLAQSHHLAESQRVANLIQEELNDALGLRDRGVKQAPFRVLMGAAMPAVLVELGFISNPEEEAKLADPAYREQLVAALVRAIERYRALVDQASGQPAAAEDGGEAGTGAEGEPDGARGAGSGPGSGSGSGEAR